MTGPRLIVRLPNWVGDVCMALPALHLLARSFTVIAVGRPWAVDLLAGMPWQTVALPRPFGPQVRTLSMLRATRGLLLTNSFGSACAMRLAGIEAIGLAGDGRSWLLGTAVPRYPGLHEVEAFWRLAWLTSAADGGWTVAGRRRWPRPPRRLELTPAAAQRHQADSALQSAGVSDRFVCVAPLAVGTIAGRNKVWPSFAELATRLSARGIAMVACPGPGEEEATAAAVPGAHLLPGLGLGAYAAVCARAAAVVANDSGPMHLAAAVDAPVLGIFGVSDPGRTAPWGLRARAIGSSAGWPEVVTVETALVSLLDPAVCAR